jgi:hypothetical protein
VKRAAVRIGADARYVAADPARRLEQTRSASRVYQARRRASARRVRENRTKKLGKLLNLSVHGATEHERLLARQKYNLLKKGTHA